MLYHYMHNSCFSLTFILPHLKLVLILWDTLWLLYHLPDSAIRFWLWITQNLCSPFSANLDKSFFFILPPAHSFHTRQCPSRAGYQSPDLLGWCYWGPSLLQAFPLFHFLLFSAPFTNMISSFSLASVAANLRACSFPFAKSESTFQHIPPLKNFHMPLPRDWQALPSQAFFTYTCAVDSFCFSLMIPTALNPFVGQEILSDDLHFCLSVAEFLCEFQQITLTFALSDLLRWQDFEERTTSYALFLWCQSEFHNSNKQK